MKQILLMITVVACGAAPAAPKPAKLFTNTLGMKFVSVPGTEVQFCIWETRVKDYAVYAGASAGVDRSWQKFFPSFNQPDTHPVVNVSWNDARAFCSWLTLVGCGKIRAGQKYRLPTDAEWSVAVGLGKERGNTPREKSDLKKSGYPWGNYGPPRGGEGNYFWSLKVDDFRYTSPGGSFAANKLGLHDMGGNVAEWCEDKYAPTISKDRVVRGASWGNWKPRFLSSSYRHHSSADFRSPFDGFRVVLVGE